MHPTLFDPGWNPRSKGSAVIRFINPQCIEVHSACNEKSHKHATSFSDNPDWQWHYQEEGDSSAGKMNDVDHQATEAGVPQTSGLAIGSLVFGVLGFFTFGLAGIVAVVLGCVGLQEAQTAKNHQSEADSKSLFAALAMYKLNAGAYPATGQGLLALVEKPEGDPVPNRWVQIMHRIPRDPWGNRYVYRLPDSGNPEIISKGADGMEGTQDDLCYQPD